MWWKNNKIKLLAAIFAAAVLIAASLCAGRVIDNARSGEKWGGEYSCTISVTCATLLDNMDKMEPEKLELVSADGVLLPETVAAFSGGDSVFDVLRRECRTAGIHLEYSETPLYGGVYIEGIGNIYEFDCGELSGWMYSVNGDFPNYSCSEHALCDGDVISFEYTCDLGADIGGSTGAEG